MSISGKARTYLVVSIDSVGYEEYYRTLFSVLGLKYHEVICKSHHVKLDTKKKYHQIYNKKLEVRKRPATKRVLKIRANMIKVLKDKRDGKAYKSGINVPKPNKKPKESKPVACIHCGLLGHKLRTHRSCLFTTHKRKGKLKQSKGCRMIYVIIIGECVDRY
jgi:hypothetical protein